MGVFHHDKVDWWTVALNIKNPEAHALARTIAARTGLSLTDAVVVALREKEARLAGSPAALEAARRARAEALLAYGRRLRPFRTGGSSDTSDLYDDALGLPE